MLTIIGTGHVFKIAEPVQFIIRHSWPQVVCVELDRSRYAGLTGDTAGMKKVDDADVPPVYKASAEYQQKISARNDSTAGAEMVAAIAEARALGAEVVCIDKDARQAMTEMWAEMSRRERFRYKWSAFTDGLLGMRKVEQTQQAFAANEEKYLADMRRKYPTLVRKLIDERNAYMAARLTEVCTTRERVVVVVGDAHVEGLAKLLPPELEVRKIRLADLLDEERMAKVRAMVWNDKEGSE